MHTKIKEAVSFVTNDESNEKFSNTSIQQGSKMEKKRARYVIWMKTKNEGDEEPSRAQMEERN